MRTGILKYTQPFAVPRSFDVSRFEGPFGAVRWTDTDFASLTALGMTWRCTTELLSPLALRKLDRASSNPATAMPPERAERSPSPTVTQASEALPGIALTSFD